MTTIVQATCLRAYRVDSLQFRAHPAGVLAGGERAAGRPSSFRARLDSLVCVTPRFFFFSFFSSRHDTFFELNVKAVADRNTR